MSLRNRPFVGGWVMNRTLVRHTPDCVVLVNGYEEFGVCPSCTRKLDLSRWITQVSADATTEPIATANLTLSVPAHAAASFSFDGNYILQPNLEVVILMRGYFPMKDFGGKGQEPEGDFDADDVPMYPYYQVFRGVVTNVTHDFSGGFYTATLSCANLLHFWQNLKLSVNGAVFGARPTNSMVEPEIIGHKFTGANPYSIIYTLVKVGFGASYGVEFTMAQTSNIRATDDSGRNSLYAHAAEWWARRWTEHSGNLRMHGINGTVFNDLEQAYLGRWYDTRDRGTNSVFYQTGKQLSASKSGGNDFNLSRSKDALGKARELAYDPLATSAAVYDRAGSGKSFATEDVLRMQAFTLDIGKMGSINMFETEYMSKMEIVEQVKTVTGYEFYQDVDGDLVFKPPLYNMDTRDDPVYRIEDRDLISLSETETEPEATMMKGTGSHFANVTGTGLEGWLGVGSVFIDYRLVAQYGYKEETFESNYMNSRQALFVSAMNRLDLANAGVKSASITIPLRPEMRAGYPVYVESLDCFFYVASLSHSFQYGGQCTTSIQGTAKRSKFLPPMQTTGEGKFPSISDVRLDAPDEYPSRPLYGYPERMSGGSESAGPPRVYGFPNVVLALDPDKVNLDTVDLDRGIITAKGYVEIALASGFLERGDEPDTFYLRTSNDKEITISLAKIQREWADAAEALAAGSYTAEPDSTLGLIIQAIERRSGGVDTPDARGLVNYLSLQTSMKSLFAPGVSTVGKYRYFSCSHPEARHQAPKNLLVDQEAGELSFTIPEKPDEGYSQDSFVITDVGGGKGIQTELREIKRGIQIAGLSQKTEASATFSSPVEVVATSDIRFVTFGPQVTRKRFRVSYVSGGASKGSNFALNGTATEGAFASLLVTRVDSDASLEVSDRFVTEYDRLLDIINTFATDLGVDGNRHVQERRDKALTPEEALKSFSHLPDDAGLMTVSAIFKKKTDAEGVSSLAVILAKALGAYVKQVIASARELQGFDGDYTQFMEYRATFIESYSDTPVPDSSPGKVYFYSDEYVDVKDWAPIFPVSDAQGYEVFGNLPYGRGVNIEKFAEIHQSTTSGDDTDSGSEASASSITQVGTRGVNAASMQSMEKFWVSYFNAGESGTAALGNLSEEDRVRVLARWDTTEDGIDAAVAQTLEGKSTSQDAKIRNAPVTSFFRGQAVFGDTAAENLANLDVGGEICACKGADASFYMEAFSEEYMDLFQGDPLQGFEEQRSWNSAEAWQASRDAMAGKTLDPRNSNLAAQFTAQGDLARTYTNSGRGLEQGLRQQGEDTEAAALALAAEVTAAFEEE